MTAWTTTALLADIRIQGRIPDDDPDATDAILLLLASRQLQEVFAPALRKVRGEYCVMETEYALTSGVSEYPIPTRSAYSSVRDVFLVDTSGARVGLPQRALIELTDAGFTGTGNPGAFCLIDDTIRLFPTPNSSSRYTMIVRYSYRLPELVLPSACQLITAVSTTTVGAVDVYRLTIATNTFAAGNTVDVWRAAPPFSAAGMDASVISIGGTYYSHLAQAFFSRAPLVGDYLNTAGQTCIPPLPPELHTLLAAVTAAEHLRVTDPETSRSLMGKVEKGLGHAQSAMEPRSTGRSMRLRPRNSMFRRGSGGGGQGSFGDWT